MNLLVNAQRISMTIALAGFFGFSFAVTQKSEAARWIAINPNLQKMQQFQIVDTIAMGSKTYVVFEDSLDQLSTYSSPFFFKNYQKNLAQEIASNSVSLDPQIEIPMAEETSPDNDEAAKAWHVDYLKYKDLPTEFDGKGVTVAVLDSGVDTSHLALASQIKVNSLEIANNGLDDDNNGLIDDVTGYNFADNTADVTDTMSHGTHCAGIIAALPEDAKVDTSARGVAPGVKILPVKVIGNNGKGFLSGAAKAFLYASDQGAQVMSNSWRIYKAWGQYYDEVGLKLLSESLQLVESKGAIVVFAAGNESTNIDLPESMDPMKNPIYPIALPNLNLVVVASSDTAHGLSYFSNYGAKQVHVAAPGSSIRSTLSGQSWGSMDGTSMATPLLAGSIARGISAGLSPRASYDLLKQSTNMSGTFAKSKITFGEVDLIAFHKLIKGE